MHVESGMLGQPLLHNGMLVRGVVVGDQVQRLALGRLTVDLAQELQPLDVRVSLLALADDLTVQHIERRKQRRGAVTPLVDRQPDRFANAAEHLHQRVNGELRSFPGDDV